MTSAPVSFAQSGSRSSGLVRGRLFSDHFIQWFLGWLAVQELESAGYDLGEVFRLAALVFVFVRLQSALDVDEAALLQILLADFGQLSPHLDVEPVCGFLVLLAGF